ncbi:hypothetical protein MYX06_04915 [Patescibacteria group bacterium AH-259-L05]|nr:hypothetical protein [Patescibacteria group bacterium AH-259-L05]
MKKRFSTSILTTNKVRNKVARITLLITSRASNKVLRSMVLILLGVFLLFSIWFFPTAIYNIVELSYGVEKIISDIRELSDDVRELSDDVEDLIDMSPELFIPYGARESMDGMGSSIDIMHVLSPFKLINDGYMDVVYHDGAIKRSVTYQGQAIRYLKLSPSNDKLGFYYNKPGQEDRAGPDVELSIADIDTMVITKVYEGGFKTSSWEWLNNREIVVYYGCGTECMVAYIIDTTNGEQTAVLQYGVGYEWSPNKKLVLTHRYTVQYGIVVGNKDGIEVFQLLRDSGPNIIVTAVKALWSPDSAKIALIIQKGNKNAMEIIVFDVEQVFKQIFQEDLTGEIQDIEFFWQHKGMALFYQDLNGEQVITF